MEVANMLSLADREIGRLDMYSEYIPNIEVYITMHVTKEAILSSKIEGTKTNIKEALFSQDELPYHEQNDWEEVQNYVTAMQSSIKRLDELSFSSRFIREAHSILLQGVRGSTKLPGEFRSSQNWIGGASINDAKFVPPVHSEIPDLMSDLEKFAHNTDILLPELLKVALIHFQFETIHPFLDGNGRVGRLMITLYLISKKILKRPVLYLSDFLEKNRTEYYNILSITRETGDISRWFKFFLTCIIETAQSGIHTFDQILKLQRETEDKILGLGPRAANARMVVENLYRKPIIDAAQVKAITGLSKPSTYALIAKLEELDILNEITGNKRGRKYIFNAYLHLFS
jgi:Fic family protein